MLDESRHKAYECNRHVVQNPSWQSNDSKGLFISDL